MIRNDTLISQIASEINKQRYFAPVSYYSTDNTGALEVEVNDDGLMVFYIETKAKIFLHIQVIKITEFISFLTTLPFLNPHERLSIVQTYLF